MMAILQKNNLKFSLYFAWMPLCLQCRYAIGILWRCV